MDLNGKRAVITGGGTGVGRAIALCFAKHGCRVAVAGRREEKLRETVSLWEGQPPLLHRPADVGDRRSVDRLFEWAAKELGPIDILVCSAGVNIKQRSLAEIDPDDWDRILQVNASGAFYCMKAALPRMRERGDGLIIHINSIAGKRASLLGGISYSAAKFAMSALATCAALEEAGHGIRVSSIYPGEINTPILDDRPEPVSDEHKARILQPEDLAHAALMIATLPRHAHVAELVIKPVTQGYA